VLNNWASFLIQ